MAKNCFKGCDVKLDVCVVGDGTANRTSDNSKMNSNNGPGTMNSSDTTNYTETRAFRNSAVPDYDHNSSGKSKSKSKSTKNLQYQDGFVDRMFVVSCCAFFLCCLGDMFIHFCLCFTFDFILCAISFLFV